MEFIKRWWKLLIGLVGGGIAIAAITQRKPAQSVRIDVDNPQAESDEAKADRIDSLLDNRR